MTAPNDLQTLFRAVANAQQATPGDRAAVERAAAELERHARPAVTTRRSRRWSGVALGFAAGTAVTLALVAAWIWRDPRPLTYVVRGAHGRSLQAPAIARPWAAGAEPVTLSFSDGSLLVLQKRGEAIVNRVGSRGADVRLARGELRADVQHTGRSAWHVSAGPFVVNVTGTRFSTSWQPAEGRLVVTLREGRVVVGGAMLGEGVPMQPGQQLEAQLSTGRYTVAPVGALADQDAAGAPDEVGEVGVVTSGAVPVIPDPPKGSGDVIPAVRAPNPPSWRTLAAAGRADEAYDAAERFGWERLCARARAPELAELGDLARWARHPGRAKQVFTALLERFPDDPRVPDAVFALGVIAADDETAPDRAAHLFRRYGQSWPDGILAAAAAGRLLEAELAMGDVDGAHATAQEYLRRFPNGPHAALAHRSADRR